MAIKLGINMEYVRHHDKPFEYGVRKAAEIGYEYVEPMVHWGRELLSEARYFHSVSMYDDPLWAREVAESVGIKFSGLSTHTPLCKPEISVEYLKQAIRWAADAGAPVVNTDEGPKPLWTTREQDYTLMTYTLTEAARVAERHGIKIGLEPHQQYSKTPDGLDSIYHLVDSPAIGINYDTGNSYLAGGSDPYEWLERVLDRLVHQPGAGRGRARQGDRHAGGLRLRRRRGRLGARHRPHQARGPRQGHHPLRRMRHHPAGGAEFRVSVEVAVAEKGRKGEGEKG